MHVQADGISVVMYHYVRPIEGSSFSGIRGLRIEAFERQLDWLQEHFHIASMAEFLDCLDRQSAPPRPTALLTFDDGLRDHITHVLPRLVERGLTASFYVSSSAVLDQTVLDVHRIQFLLASIDDQVVTELVQEIAVLARGHLDEGRWAMLQDEARTSRFDTADVILLKRLLQRELPRDLRRRLTQELFRAYVSADEVAFAEDLYLGMTDLRRLRDAGMHVGSHADTHEWLTNLTADEQSDELVRSLDVLDALGVAVDWTLAYPYGSNDERTLSTARRLGCRAAFTTAVGPAPMLEDRRLSLPRYDTNDFPQ